MMSLSAPDVSWPPKYVRPERQQAHRLLHPFYDDEAENRLLATPTTPRDTTCDGMK